MGLSNEERYERIAHSIGHVVELAEDLDKCKLKKLAETLWYAFLGKESNSMFWFTGSELSGEHMPAGTLISTAFKMHKPSKKQEHHNEEFNTYNILRGFFDMEKLLDKPQRAVLLIQLHTQSISYALCRYPDEFMDEHEALNIQIRSMQGECFKMMKSDSQYAHAWMLHSLCDKVYTFKDDIVNQWWNKHYHSHKIKLEWDEFELVYNLFKKYQFRTLSIQDRIDITLALIRKKYYEHEHVHKEFMEMVKAYNNKNKVKIKVEPIEKAYKDGKKLKDAAMDKPYERECELTGNYLNDKNEVENLYDY